MSNISWHVRARDADLHVSNFINGVYEDCLGEQFITKHSARDGVLLHQFPVGTGHEVDAAVAIAQQAFFDGRWHRQTTAKRKKVLQKLADLMEANKEELALYDCLDVGKPITSTLNEDIPLAAAAIRTCAEGADKLFSPSGSDGGATAYQLRKPVGVVGSIIGWNFPLWMAAIKVGPALAMGNSLVLKPSEFSPRSAGKLAQLALEAGVPPGVFNVVQGAGKTVGAALAKHPDVNLLSFTGSSATGKQMMIAAGQSNMKRLMLECGGKSPYLVFDDCPDDLDFIAADVVETAFRNQGQWCCAGSRLLIQKSIKEKLLPKILEQAARLVPGDPLDPKTTFGALIHEAHMNKVLGFIESGKKEGAKLILGGQRVHLDTGDASSDGYYVPPTIFDEVQPHYKIAQEEIFGPVLSILTFDDEAEAIALANNSCYGLMAYAATENLARAQRLAQQINSGCLVIVGSSTLSDGNVDIGASPLGQSGFGYESGLEGLASYTVSTTTHLLT